MWPFGSRGGKQIAEEKPTPAAYGAATSLRSWEYVFKLQFGNYVPLLVDYAIYDAIREGIPFVDTALRKLSRLVSGFKVACPSQATADRINAWLYSVRTFGVCSGFDTFEASYTNSLLQYGKACAEIVLTQTGRDVYELTMVPTKNLYIVTGDQGGLMLGEYRGGVLTAYPRQELFAYSALNVQGDNPHGSSILRSLPFTTNTMLVMENALRQRWMRHGAPAFMVVEELPSELLIEATDITARQAAWKLEWNAAMRDRWEQQGIRDFFAVTQGKFRVDPVEPGPAPDYTEPLRSLEEQIVASTELAPFMLGLQWSTTERLSQQQADMIISLIMAIREEIGPAYLHIADTWARLNGIRTELRATWPDVSLQDAVETSRAELQSAQALKVRTDAALAAWRNGWVDQVGAAREAGYDIEQPVIALEAPIEPAQGGGGGGLAFVGDGGNGRAGAMWGGYPSLNTWEAEP